MASGRPTREQREHAMRVSELAGTQAVDALIDSARRGRLAEVHAALGSGVPVDSLGCYGMTPLAAAARAGRESMVKALLAAGADPNFELGLAAREAQAARKPRCLSLLAEAGADLEERHLLHWAAEDGDFEMVGHLLALGADPLRLWMRRTPPAMAASMGGGHSDHWRPAQCVEALLSKALPGDFGSGSEYVANAIRRDEKAGPTELAFLESIGVDLDAPMENEGGRRPLEVAAWSGCAGAAKELMGLAWKRGRPPKDWKRAVAAAAKAGRPELSALIRSDMQALSEAADLRRSVGKAGGKPSQAGKGLRI